MGSVCCILEMECYRYSYGGKMELLKIKNLSFIFLLCTGPVYAGDNRVVIRPAQIEDLPAILTLDYDVTFEFFKPLYIQSYSHLIDPAKVDYFLGSEVANDAKTFPNIITEQGNDRLHIAYDTSTKNVAGLLLFHKDEDLVELDLLLVGKDYRKMGAGRKLVYSTINTFEDTKAIIVYPLNKDNYATLKFYESIGFNNLGPALLDKKNVYGVNYSDMYFYYRLDLENNKITRKRQCYRSQKRFMRSKGR